MHDDQQQQHSNPALESETQWLSRMSVRHSLGDYALYDSFQAQRMLLAASLRVLELRAPSLYFTQRSAQATHTNGRISTHLRIRLQSLAYWCDHCYSDVTQTTQVHAYHEQATRSAGYRYNSSTSRTSNGSSFDKAQHPPALERSHKLLATSTETRL